MVTLADYGTYETAWCPGCGNFSIAKAVKQALVASNLKPHEVLFVSGIGQAAKAPHYLNANVFNGLHGRSLPVATGAKLSNSNLTVMVESGDGCNYGEGGNHFLAAIRRNIDVTLLVHNNQVYGLTKGQASPTSDEGFVTKAQPRRAICRLQPDRPGRGHARRLVARGFAGMIDHLSELIQQGIAHHGFALIDILQPCVSFNTVNTFAWYEKRCNPLSPAYDPTDWEQAIKVASEWGDKIPTGIIYRNDRIPFEEHFPALNQGPLIGRNTDRAMLKTIMEGYK